MVDHIQTRHAFQKDFFFKENKKGKMKEQWGNV